MKHCRLAMMASIGFLAQHYFRLPGGVFDEVPNGAFAATDPTGAVGCGIITFACLPFEFSGSPLKQDPSKEIGDFGDPLNFNAMAMGAPMREMRNRELNNGRFAMFAVVGILLAEVATGQDALEQLSLA